MRMLRVLLLILLLVLCTRRIVHAREVEFGWEPMEGALSYEIQISADAKFTKPMIDQKTEKPDLNASLEMGRYFYRVRVIDKKNRPGHWSAPQVVVVTPYPPELVGPKNGTDLSYFEVLPAITFDWKPVQASTSQIEYDVLIYKTTGQKMQEARVKDTQFTTNKIGEGEFLWKVRTVAQGIYISDYCEPRRFQVAKKPLTAPRQVEPEENGNFAAYRKATFKWEQDPVTKFTDLTIETLPSSYTPKASKKTYPNLTGSEFSMDYFEPGDYAWSIRTKEAKDTPGVIDGPQSFHSRDDIISGSQIVLEYGISPTYYTDEVTSTRNVPQETSMTSTDQAKFQSVTLGYYPWDNVGFFFRNKMGEMNLQGHSALNHVADGTIHFKGGMAGFQQEFLIGYHQEDFYEIYDQFYNKLTVQGPYVGTRVIGTPMQRWRLVLEFGYFKGTNLFDYNAKINLDEFEGAAGLKYNFLDRLWIGYRFSYTKGNGQYRGYTEPDASSTSLSATRIEPMFFYLSLEQ